MTSDAELIEAISSQPAPKNPYNLTDFAMKVWSILQTQPLTLPEIVLATSEPKEYCTQAVEGLAACRGGDVKGKTNPPNCKRSRIMHKAQVADYIHINDEGFPLEYLPDKCVQCGAPTDPMYPYVTLTISNTEDPELTTHHFDTVMCLMIFKEKQAIRLQGEGATE